MRRYKFLGKEDIFDSLNRLRNAFLASRDGKEVDEIINGILTSDERIKIGRRILISEYILSGFTLDEIIKNLKVGKNTVMNVSRLLEEHPNCFELIERRSEIVDKEYKNKRYKTVGGSTKVFKSKVYTGFTIKDVKRK